MDLFLAFGEDDDIPHQGLSVTSHSRLPVFVKNGLALHLAVLVGFGFQADEEDVFAHVLIGIELARFMIPVFLHSGGDDNTGALRAPPLVVVGCHGQSHEGFSKPDAKPADARALFGEAPNLRVLIRVRGNFP